MAISSSPSAMSTQLGKWSSKAAAFFVSAISWIVFVFLDFLEVLLCNLYRLADQLQEEKASPSCYCVKIEDPEDKIVDDDEIIEMESELSETLVGRHNLFRSLMGSSLSVRRARRNEGTFNRNRWSDCGCDSCIDWIKDSEELRLHVVVRDPQKDSVLDCKEKDHENVIFVHGFLASSSFWTETVFPNMPVSVQKNYRLFAVDLLGFGRSPKPSNCFYTLRDHLEMIEKSVINSYQLESFHLVAHSMGCVIALALAARHIKSIKSVSLIAPPYFSSDVDASLMALQRLAPRKMWPPKLFGSAIMSWYEHLGRTVCFIICRNHRTWEAILKFITRKRDLHFAVMDLTRHTHHSAWHTMHNVICGGAKLMDKYLNILREAKVRIRVIQGARDDVVPVECSISLKMKVKEAEVQIIDKANHTSVVFGRETDLLKDLQSVWSSTYSLDERHRNL